MLVAGPRAQGDAAAHRHATRCAPSCRRSPRRPPSEGLGRSRPRRRHRPRRRRQQAARVRRRRSPTSPATDWATPLARLGLRHDLLAIPIHDPRELDVPPIGLVAAGRPGDRPPTRGPRHRRRAAQLRRGRRRGGRASGSFAVRRSRRRPDRAGHRRATGSARSSATSPAAGRRPSTPRSCGDEPTRFPHIDRAIPPIRSAAVTSSTRNGCGCCSPSPRSPSPTSACPVLAPRATVRFTQVDLLDRVAPQRPGWRRHVVAGVQLLGLAAGVVAIARPVDHGDRAHQAARAASCCCSTCRCRWRPPTSSPTRLDAAQEAARDFVDQVDADVEVGPDLLQRRRRRRGRPDARPRARSTTASTTSSSPSRRRSATRCRRAPRCWCCLAGDSGPPTTDATGAPTGPPPGAIVLLTDGETTVGRPTDGRRPGGGRRRHPGVHDRLRHRRRLDHRPGQRRDDPGPGAARRRCPRSPTATGGAGLRRRRPSAELTDAYQQHPERRSAPRSARRSSG